MDSRFLSGRTAWVTGGASGIGRGIALALGQAGAAVAIGSLPRANALPDAAYAARLSDAELVAAARDVEATGARCFSQGFDLRSDASVQGFHDAAVAALGPIDILVNAAGVSCQQAIVDADDATWQTVIDINLNGAYRTIKRCLPGMVARGWGRIVNIVSTAAHVGYPRYGAYCASKSALLGLTRCVALEGAAHGVACNAINPGSVDTPMCRIGSERRIKLPGQGGTVEENLALIAAQMPQKRLIPIEEIAALALFLCRDEARGLTMEDIAVSGGALW